MDTQDDTQSSTGSSSATAHARKTYRRPELVEFGDVRELTRGGGKTKKETKFTKKK